jgi:tetratricopeptide (TPR) repeat protein
MADKFVRGDALAALTALSLLRREHGPAGSILIFHRLLQEVVRDWMGGDAHSFWSGAAVTLVDLAFPHNVTTEPSTWPFSASLMPHVAPLEVYAPRTGAAGKALDHLLNLAALYLMTRGDGDGALALAERSVALKRLTRTNEPLSLAAALNNLAGAYYYLDRLDEAENAYREALEIYEPRVVADDQSLAVTSSNLAGLHIRRKDFANAEQLFLRAAEIMKAACGPDSAEYATSLSNLGVLYGQWADELGQAAHRAQAVEYTTKALQISLTARGTRHPETAISYYNLAGMKANMGNWRGAATEAARSVAILGSLDLADHPDTQRRTGELLHFWEQSGQPDKAARLQSGDISDLLPVIAQVEAEHRAWVAKDPKNRHFGPPSPFASER